MTVVFVFLLFDVIKNNGTVSIPEGALHYDGNYYWVYENGTVASWKEAEEYCEEQGGHLAVITSGELNDMLFAYVQSKGYKTAFLDIAMKELTEIGDG